MIFVMTGTEAFPFNRFIVEVDSMIEDNVFGEEVFMQIGSCTVEPRHCKWVKYMPFNEVREKIVESTAVITHAGAGSTLLCLELGKKPLIVTRRKEHGEHLDDHQVPFARMMESLDYAVPAYDVSDLRKSYSQIRNSADSDFTIKRDNSALTGFLERYYDSV